MSLLDFPAERDGQIRLSEHSAADDHHLNFGCAFIDLGDLGITHHALDGIVTGVAIAAVQLYAATCNITCIAGSNQLSLCSQEGVRLALVNSIGCLIDKKSQR